MENEIWKDIPWWEWLYQISSLWRVKSLHRYVKNWSWYRTVRERIIIWSPDYFWYIQLSLSNWNKSLKTRIHRLIGVVFLGIDKSDTDICVLHRDDNPRNNRLDNLFIWTRADNAHDREMKWRWKWLSWKDSYFFWRKWKDHHSSIPVLQYSLSWYLIKKWESATVIERELWFGRSNIQDCCRYSKKQKQSNWFLWRFSWREIPMWLRLLVI